MATYIRSGRLRFKGSGRFICRSLLLSSGTRWRLLGFLKGSELRLDPVSRLFGKPELAEPGALRIARLSLALDLRSKRFITALGGGESILSLVARGVAFDEPRHEHSPLAATARLAFVDRKSARPHDRHKAQKRQILNMRRSGRHGNA